MARGTQVYGIVAAQCPDNAGETILIDGVDISRLNLMKDEHPEQDSFWYEIGHLRNVKKIYSEKDCDDDKQLRCWRYAQVPIVYAEGEFADTEDHPNAKAASALFKFSQRPDVPLDIGWSIDGGIAERRTVDGAITEDKESGKILARTVGLAASLTVKRCNPKCKVFMHNDLTKSDLTAPPPPRYFELLQKSQSKSSIIESLDSDRLMVYSKLQTLKKSLDDYFGGFTSMRCTKCSQPVRFFKSTKSMPHMCSECRGVFSMKDIWNAINR